MNQTYLDVFEIIRSSLCDDIPSVSEKPDWNEIYEVLDLGKMLGVTNKTAMKVTGSGAVPADIASKWNSTVFHDGFVQMCATSDILRILKSAQDRSISLTLFKGPALGILYPEPSLRFSCDVDIFVSTSDLEKTSQLLLDLGFIRWDECSKDHVPVFAIENAQDNHRLKVELHDQLWEGYDGKLVDTLKSMDLTNPDSLLSISINGIEAKTLGYEQHLIYQLFHIAKHFSFKGLQLKYLTDITLYVNHYYEKIDWDRFYYNIGKLGYVPFTDNIFSICIQYLGMKVPSSKHSYKLNDSLISDIMLLGKIDDNNQQDWESTELLESYFLRDKKNASSWIGKKREIFFPLPSELKDKFSYAKKCPIFLPIAWCHRFISALNYSHICKKKGIKVSNVLDKAEYRLKLMREVGIIE